MEPEEGSWGDFEEWQFSEDEDVTGWSCDVHLQLKEKVH